MQRDYESMVVVKADISEEERSDVFAKITKKIEELEGKIENARVWAKERALSYPLISSGAEKKRHNQACYWLVNFNIDGEKMGGLKELMRLDERILRSLIF
jgi:ribosomal protein S6